MIKVDKAKNIKRELNTPGKLKIIWTGKGTESLQTAYMCTEYNFC